MSTELAKSVGINEIRGLLERMKPQMTHALPKHMKADRMARIALTTMQRNPELLNCSQASLLGCIIQASQLGLEPDGILGHAYLIPYKGVCTLIIGYKGLVDLARRSGQISTIAARAVYEKDEFEYAYGLEETCTHTPSTESDPGKLLYVYAVAKLRDGGRQFEVMNMREIEAIRKRSRAGGNGPWVTDFEMMAKKTVLRRLCKLLPASIELARAVAIDEAPDADLPQDLTGMIDIAADDKADESPASEPEGKRISLGTKPGEQAALPTTEGKK